MEQSCKMRVIGIDPGNKESAYCIIEGNEILQAETIVNPLMLGKIDLWSYTNRADEIQIGIEMIQSSYGMPVGKEVFNTVFWIGRFFERWMSKSPATKPWMLYRNQIKNHIGVGPRGKDKDVRAAMIKRFGEPGKKKEKGQTFGLAGDMWSALAVAATRQDQLRHLYPNLFSSESISSSV